MKKKLVNERPSAEILEAELNRIQYRHRYSTVLKSTVYALITVAALAVTESKRS